MATVQRPLEDASPAQLQFIFDLAKKHEINDEQAAFIVKLEGGYKINKGQASRIIDTMKSLPKRNIPALWPSVPAGRYACFDPKDGVLKFYRVDRPTEGRWAGYLFLNVYASEEQYPIKNHEHRDQIMAEIDKDPQAAAILYGKEIGRCGICGRKLTNEISRELGIGPICRARVGWAG